jgi:transcriptional regulator with XRE-family HTH domain
MPLAHRGARLRSVTEDERAEAGRRARAAVAYSGLGDKAVAAAMGFSTSTLQRIYSGQREQTAWDDLWAIADACSVPREWFSADIERLGEIVAEGMPAFPTPDQRAVARAREARALQVKARQRGARPEGAPDTKPAPRRRRAQGD